MLFGLVTLVQQIVLPPLVVLLSLCQWLLQQLQQLALANKVTLALLLGNITEFGKA